MSNSKKIWIIVSLMIVLFISIMISCSVGISLNSFKAFLSVIAYKFGLINNVEPLSLTIIWQMRLPRILVAMATGIALAQAGCVYQGIFRNPLVEPFILGVSSGAAFGAAIAIILGGFFLSVQISALLFALLAVLCAYLIGRVRGETPLVSLILGGIIINSLFSSLVSLLQYVSNSSELREVVFWLLGGFYYTNWSDAYLLLPITLVGTFIVWLLGWKLNILSQGDEEAKALGVNVERLKIFIIILTTLITSVSVSTVGIIPWVGLMIPHASRLIVGPDHRYLIPTSAILGGIFLIACDTLSRSIASSEIPIGILTSIVGAPYLILLVKTKRKVFFG